MYHSVLTRRISWAVYAEYRCSGATQRAQGSLVPGQGSRPPVTQNLRGSLEVFSPGLTISEGAPPREVTGHREPPGQSTRVPKGQKGSREKEPGTRAPGPRALRTGSSLGLSLNLTGSPRKRTRTGSPRTALLGTRHGLAWADSGAHPVLLACCLRGLPKTSRRGPRPAPRFPRDPIEMHSIVT